MTAFHRQHEGRDTYLVAIGYDGLTAASIEKPSRVGVNTGNETSR